MNSSATLSSSRVVTPGLDALLEQRQRLGDDAAGAGHRLDLGFGLADDHSAPSSGATWSSAAETSAQTSSIDALAVQRHELAGRAVVLDDRLGLRVVDLEALRDHVARVVEAVLDLGALERALHPDLVRDVEEEDRVEPAADAAEHRVERLRLREVAREAVEDEALARIVAPEALLDHRDRQFVGDELARGHDLADAAAELGAGLLLCPEHVARRDVRNAVLAGDALGLRALAGALGAEDEEVHFRKPS